MFWGNFRGTDAVGFPIIPLFLVSLHSDLALGIGCLFFFQLAILLEEAERCRSTEQRGGYSLLMMLFI